jgi:CRP-like cAMP-binding protein
VSNPSSDVFLEISAGAPTEVFRAGEVLMRQGEPGGFCFVVLNGTVFIELIQADGHRQRLASRGVGELIGELSLFQTTRSATVIAETECVCARISHAALLQIVAGQPAVALALLAATMKKVREYACEA